MIGDVKAKEELSIISNQLNPATAGNCVLRYV